MTQDTAVARLHNEITAIKAVLVGVGDMSLISQFEAIAAKSLLLAAASHFERKVTDDVLEHCKLVGGNNVLVQFIQKQALSRKFHTMFDWESGNLNKFFALFGQESKREILAGIAEKNLKNGADAFYYINQQRNLLVHTDYAAFNLDATHGDIWNKFLDASNFWNWLSLKLKELLLRPD